MRTLIITLTMVLLICGSLWAQDDTTDVSYYERNWISHRFIDPSNDVTRSIAYNRITDHILVATRKGSPRVVILDAATGDSVGTLSIGAGYTNGVYPINMIAVSQTGTIYLSNLCAPQYSPSDVVKIYRYADEDAEPEVVFEDGLDGIRYGDAMACISGEGETFLYIGGQGTDVMAILRDTGGAELEDWETMNLPMTGNARHGISPMEPGGRVWVNGADSGYPPPTLLSGDGDIIAIVPDSLFSAGGSAAITHMILGNYNIVSVINPYSATIRSARWFEDELGGIAFDYFGGNSDSLDLDYSTGYMGDANGTGMLIYDPERNALITLLGVNSISSMSLEPMLKTSTPRAGILEISVDGQDDFFPSDLIDESEGRELYMTWSEGKVFFGLTEGNVMVDPTLSTQFHFAFDLNLAGGEGSATPPIAGTGITTYPFMADVVYAIDSWEESDFLSGTIYKWNGSSWDGIVFEDFGAATGALAWVDDLFEFAAIKNAPGLGEDVSSLAFFGYLTDNSGADLLGVFPSSNTLNAGSSHGNYFFVDSLGTDMFPTNPEHVQILSNGTAIDPVVAALPEYFILESAFPNPFNPETTIKYSLTRPAEISLTVYDLRGAEILSTKPSLVSSGTHVQQLNMADHSSGVYLYHFTVNGVVQSAAKLLLLK